MTKKFNCSHETEEVACAFCLVESYEKVDRLERAVKLLERKLRGRHKDYEALYDKTCICRQELDEPVRDCPIHLGA